MKKPQALSLFLLIALWVAPSFQTLGVDMSLAQCHTATKSDWECLVKEGYTFAIIEAWDGGYQFDDTIAQCVADAWAAGMAHVDVYAFLCPNCDGNSPSSSAVKTLVDKLKSANVKFGMLWFDVEQCSGCWNSASDNAQFLAEAVDEADNLGVKVGIYSSEYEWGATVGSYSGLTKYPLWYAHYDDSPSFNDSPYWHFGGWTTPAIKQYWDHGPSACAVSVDVNYY
eukprot:TRINITY_DN9769_c0_g1_i1.p1 TRINITY_DN9769_c0_g1~~TRINITY_DN9769_c0_g1_i1.p1  ORF type:complete len:240 (-),score=52.70 TRINITY_DN9769_c0_g1_i1:95-772(-)